MAKSSPALWCLLGVLALGSPTIAEAVSSDPNNPTIMKMVTYPKLDKKALGQLVKSAENGDASAQQELASRHLLGQSVPQDFKLFEKWMRKAAESGHYPAQRALADVYWGLGFTGIVPLDHVESYKWRLLSLEIIPKEEKGKAMVPLTFYEQQLTSAQLTDAKRRADLVRAGYKK